MFDCLYLTLQYLRFHKWKTVTLVASVALILFVPAGLQVLVNRTEEQLGSRADQTPLIIGARGSRLDLVLNALYFNTEVPPRTVMREADRVSDSGFADVIPIHTRFHAQSYPIVGTTLEYFRFRRLTIGQGRLLTVLGDCVLGSEVARSLDVGPGDELMSSPENPFDLAGAYPLMMNIVGVLAATDGPDDLAVFVDLKTAWIIEGIGHGHKSLVEPDAADLLLDRDENSITANAAVVPYTEITENNVNSFHFHGKQGEFPITAVIAVPHDEKSATLLRGRYLKDDDPSQIIVPTVVITKLLGTILRVRTWILAAAALIGLATLLTITLVFVLSVRLRQREIRTMHRLGCSRGMVASMLWTEILLVAGAAVIIAAFLTVLTTYFGSELIRRLLI